MVQQERACYYESRDKAIRDPENYLSIIIDGADQSSYVLPYFYEKTKSLESKHKLKYKLMGGLAHGHSKSYLMAIPMNGDNGPNLTIETLHQILVDLYATRGYLSKTLFLKLDNCTSQKKTNYVMVYLSLLVEWRLFEEVILTFLPVGHTHEDVDQMFSRLNLALQKVNAVTIGEFLAICKRAFRPEPDCQVLKFQSNWTEKLNKDPEFCPFEGITKFQAFRFVRDEEGAAVMAVKRLKNDSSWIMKNHRYFARRRNVRQFFANFPPSRLAPIDVEKEAKIRATIEACAIRILSDY